jgi:hypothetical protein
MESPKVDFLHLNNQHFSFSKRFHSPITNFVPVFRYSHSTKMIE